MHKLTLLGNLGKDPETRYTQGGAMNVSFSCATTDRYTDSSGQVQEKTHWFNVTCWGKLAEIMDKLAQDGALLKGKQVLVTGDVEVRVYTKQDGTQGFSAEVPRADTIRLTGSRENAPS